jgi:hypothetical protein
VLLTGRLVGNLSDGKKKNALLMEKKKNAEHKFRVLYTLNSRVWRMTFHYLLPIHLRFA